MSLNRNIKNIPSFINMHNKEVMYVYELVDPLTNEVRYIGRTNNLNKRYSDHVNNKKSNKHKINWISKLKREGYRPLMRVIALTTKKFIKEAEVKKISQKSKTCKLINMTLGGDGCLSMQQSTKDKISKALKGKIRSKQHCENISKALKGRKPSKKCIENAKLANTNRIPKNAIKILCLNNGKIYNSQAEAARKLKLNKSKVNLVCNGKRLHTQNYKFIKIKEINNGNKI